MSLIPFEQTLIDRCILTNDQVWDIIESKLKILKLIYFKFKKVDWLNKYYTDIRDKVGPRLKENHKDVYSYMIKINLQCKI